MTKVDGLRWFYGIICLDATSASGSVLTTVSVKTPRVVEPRTQEYYHTNTDAD